MASKQFADYYSKVFCLFEIVKCLNHRETAFFILREKEKPFVVRGIKAFTLDFFNRSAAAYRFFTRPCKLYHSLAVVEPFETLSYNPKKRREQRKALNEAFPDLMYGYDWGFDFDGVKGKEVSTRSKVYRDACTFKAELEEKQVPYTLKFSGSKGFHFVIPHKFLSQPDPMDSVETCGLVTDNIKSVFNLKTLDDKIADFRRIWKASYSVDFVELNGETIENIALPLADKQFETFDYNAMSLRNVIRDVRIKERGTLLRDHNLTTEKLKNNVVHFINEWKVLE